MAKSFRNGLMTLDSAGQGFNGRTAETYATNADGTFVTNPAIGTQTLNQRITSITVDPSAAAWAVILTDQDNNVIWSQDGAAKTGDTYKVMIDTHGVVLNTATNITRVVLSVELIQW